MTSIRRRPGRGTGGSRLNGLPILDGRPQEKAESDEEKTETYIDALNFSLKHRTSDLYIPLVGGAMSLSVKRSVVAEVWSSFPGCSRRICWTVRLGIAGRRVRWCRM